MLIAQRVRAGNDDGPMKSAMCQTWEGTERWDMRERPNAQS